MQTSSRVGTTLSTWLQASDVHKRASMHSQVGWDVVTVPQGVDACNIHICLRRCSSTLVRLETLHHDVIISDLRVPLASHNHDRTFC